MGIREHFAERWDSQDILDSLWRVVASPYTTMLLLLSLAAVAACGIILPQRPAEALADPLAESLWTTSLRERYPGTADGLLRFGLVGVYRSAWLRGLLGFLALNLLLGMVEWICPPRWLPAGLASMEGAVRSLLPTQGEQTPATPEGNHSASLPGAAGDAMRRACQILRTQGFRIRGNSQNDTVYAQRFALFPVLVYVGALLVLGGAALGERTAWWEEGFILAPGQVRPLGHNTGLAVRAETDGGAQTRLTFFRGNREVGRKVLQAHAPSLYDHLLFYATASEPALRVRAEDVAGRGVSLQTPETGATQFAEVALRFREEEASSQYIVVLNLTPGGPTGRQYQQKGNERYVLVPSRDLTLRLRYAAGGSESDPAPTFQVEAFRGGETVPFYRQYFTGDNSLQIDGDLYTFEPQHYSVVRFGQDYGLILVFGGVVLLLVGILSSTGRPPQRLWLLSQSVHREVELYLIVLPHTAAGTLSRASGEGPVFPWFENVVQTLATQLAWHERR